MVRRLLDLTYKSARRIVVGVVGGTVVLVGVVLIFVPGPAFVVIPAGLAILGAEFAWARRWLKTIGDGARSALGGNSTTSAGGEDRDQLAREPGASESWPEGGTGSGESRAPAATGLGQHGRS